MPAHAVPDGYWNAVTSILDRYQRIAPLYDLLDLPFEYSRYRKLRPLLFEGMRDDPGRRCRHRTQLSILSDRREGRWDRSQSGHAGARAAPTRPSDAPQSSCARWTSRISISRSSLSTARSRHFCSAYCRMSCKRRRCAEIKRVLKPGGMLRLLEYTRPSGTVSPRGHQALGTLGALGLRGELRPPHRTVHSGGRDCSSSDSRFVVDDLIKLMTARVATTAG